MSLVHPQLAAFTAILEEGSFEAAAAKLSVTPSAISQRIRALEDRLGQALVVRTSPCRPTPAGERLLRRVRPMQVLEHEALADFEPAGVAARPIPIAVNADSLHTWFIEALATLHRAHGLLFDLQVDDQDHTLELLRDGSVLGAVTAVGQAIQGCNVRLLGAMRYLAIASPGFARRYFPQGMDAASLAAAPMVVFNRKDDLQWRFLRRITRARIAPPLHYIPSATGFVDAAALGLGWCMVPEALARPAIASGRTVQLEPDRWLDVPLYWQHAAVPSTTLELLGRAFDAAAGQQLR